MNTIALGSHLARSAQQYSRRKRQRHTIWHKFRFLATQQFFQKAEQHVGRQAHSASRKWGAGYAPPSDAQRLRAERRGGRSAATEDESAAGCLFISHRGLLSVRSGRLTVGFSRVAEQRRLQPVVGRVLTLSKPFQKEFPFHLRRQSCGWHRYRRYSYGWRLIHAIAIPRFVIRVRLLIRGSK